MVLRGRCGGTLFGAGGARQGAAPSKRRGSACVPPTRRHSLLAASRRASNGGAGMGRRDAVGRRGGARTALLALTALLATMSAAVARENYALIVAASDYPNLPQQFWLKGPKNDAGLVRDYLLHDAPVKFEPQNVVTLGSGDGLELATHQHILDQLAAIAAKAKPGDFVFLQFSGHGSQQ